MIYEEWVTPRTYDGNDMPPGPTPEKAELRADFAYLVIATVEDCDENGEIWYNVINHKREKWSLSQRHFRTVQIDRFRDSITRWLMPLEIMNEPLEHVVDLPLSEVDVSTDL